MEKKPLCLFVTELVIKKKKADEKQEGSEVLTHRY